MELLDFAALGCVKYEFLLLDTQRMMASCYCSPQTETLLYSFPKVAGDKALHAEWLKQQKLVLSCLRRLKLQRQAVSRFFLRILEGGSDQMPWHRDRGLLLMPLIHSVCSVFPFL